MSFCLPWLARPIQMQQLICLGQPVLSIMAGLHPARLWGAIQAAPTLVLAGSTTSQLTALLRGGVCPERVAWPCFCSCPYPDRLQLQPSLSSSRVVHADGSVILVWLLLPHPQAVQVIPSPPTLPGPVPAQCCCHATQALDQG